MEIGFSVTVRTFAEFLNKTFGTKYDCWMKSTYDVNETTVAWMIRLDGKERNGFRNYFYDGKIIEESKTEPTRSFKPVRMVFQILEHDNLKTFIYIGKYEMDKRSTLNRRVFKLID